MSEKHFLVGSSKICTPDKPDHTTLEVPSEPEKETVQESGDKTIENLDDSEEIVINRPKSRFTPTAKSKGEITVANDSETKSNDKIEDEDEEIVIKRPIVKTPMNNVQRRLTIGKISKCENIRRFHGSNVISRFRVDLTK